MGVLNATPDSFYAASRRPLLSAAVEAACQMVESGVDIIDVGGESTRPGAPPVPADVERERVVPVIAAIRRESAVSISVDTSKADVARAAIDAGADLVNDVTALRGDRLMASLVADRDVRVVLMHMRGTPRTMQEGPFYEDTLAEICGELRERVDAALAAGIPSARIILDPGIGFGKRLEDNLRILRGLDRIKALGFPVVIGLSRKSFLGMVVGRPTEERLAATITANTLAILSGADIVRVHDYREAVDMVRVLAAVAAVEV